MKPLISIRLFACIAVLLLPLITRAETLDGRVVSVHDGDTLTLLSYGGQTHKIRLGQIDAPELDQPYGQKSRDSLASLVSYRSVRVEVETLDKYGRIVGTVYVGGQSVNREQIRRGMAWAYRQYLHDASLIEVENTAHELRMGLWQDSKPTEPWSHRHSCGSKRYCNEMDSCAEAKRYLHQCGLSHLDKDHDGVPCESLCGK